MVRRNSGNDAKLLKAQYALLRDALDSYYTGKQEQALNIATRIRVLVHDQPGTKNRSLLSRLNPDYWDLPIYDKPPLSKDTGFGMRTSVMTGAKGSTHIMRPIFIEKMYQRVSMKVWWTSDYQPLGGKWLSKKTIVLTVANKDGGTHIGEKISDAHAILSEPPFRYGSNIGGVQHFIQPNMAYAITAQAGCELQEYLERHFLYVSNALNRMHRLSK